MILTFKDKTWDLPEIVDYEEYSYNKSCRCDNCDFWKCDPSSKKGIVGYSSTANGNFLCFVCPQCGAKYRYHYTRDGEKFGDFEQWKKDVALALYLQDYKKFEIK